MLAIFIDSNYIEKTCDNGNVISTVNYRRVASGSTLFGPPCQTTIPLTICIHATHPSDLHSDTRCIHRHLRLLRQHPRSSHNPIRPPLNFPPRQSLHPAHGPTGPTLERNAVVISFLSSISSWKAHILMTKGCGSDCSSPSCTPSLQ